MNKRGQFYLIAAIILIAIAISFVSLENKLETKSFQELDLVAQELDGEVQHVMDYSANNGEDKINDFITKYVKYSSVDNLYFIYGTSDSINVVAYQRFSSGKIYADGAQIDIEKSVLTEPYNYNPSETVTLDINEVNHIFDIQKGQNFYVMISFDSSKGDYVFVKNE